MRRSTVCWIAVVVCGLYPAHARGDASLFVVAGGEADGSGRGSVATQLGLYQYESSAGPVGLADGSFLLPDNDGNRILRVTAAGRWSALAGMGRDRDFGGDGGPATRASLARPSAVAPSPSGGFLVSDSWNDRVRRVGADGLITTVAGSGADAGDGGDGGPAALAQLPSPGALAALSDGGFLVVSRGRVRRVLPDGTIVAFAGTGESGFGGDGGPAVHARLTADSLSLAADGSVLIGGGRRVRRVALDGTISTVAGSGSTKSSGDGGPAAKAGITAVTGVHALPDAGFLIADPLARRIRRVDPAGMISTMIGPGAFRDFAGRESYVPAWAGVPLTVTVVPDGILLHGHRAVLYAPTMTPLRPAIRITGVRVRGTRAELALASTRPGTVTLGLRRHGRTVATVPAQPVAPGAQRLAPTPRVDPGVYIVRAALRAGSGVATDEVTLVLGSRLTMRVARNALGVFAEGDGTTYFESVPYRCRRLSRRRIDCMIAEGDYEGHVRCTYVAATVLGRDGVLREHQYLCPRRGHPMFRPRPGNRGTGTPLRLDW